MYFPIGWPKILDTQSLGDQIIRKICCDRVKILFTVLTDDSISIWFTKVSFAQQKKKLIRNVVWLI